MEVTALSVGKSVLIGALGYAKSAFAEEVALQLGIQRDHAFIRDELEMMLAFLMAAHEERDEHKVVKTWVKQVRDVAYEVEDSLQDFAIRLGKPTWWHISRMLIDRHRIATQMKELRSKVEDVSQRNVRYCLIKGSDIKPAIGIGRFSMDDAMMLGSEDARRLQDTTKMDLCDLINNTKEDKHLRVISVWGTSGVLGQTSIITRAYENLKRTKKFQCYAWIRIMHPFNPPEFLQCIMREFYVNALEEEGRIQEKVTLGAQVLRKMGSMKHDDLIDEFNELVIDKSYLIVLNDLSTVEEWYWIKTYLPDSKKGCRIIVSAEQSEVASLCVGHECEQLELKQSSADHIIYAFCHKALIETEYSAKKAITDSSNIMDGARPSIKPKVSAYTKSFLIGRNEEKDEIIKQILDKDSQQLQVVSICGMGGLGKTILAKHIFHSPELSSMFEKRACVTINRPFDPKDLISSLMMQLKEVSGDKIKEGAKKYLAGLIVVKEKSEDAPSLASLLNGKKYLIVLDDLSTTTEWDTIMQLLRTKTETASRIIVTTRKKKIAKYCSQKDEKYIFKLKNLGKEDAWKLFTEKVFGKTTDLKMYPELVDEANLILKRCGGLPLAIVTIGGFLANQPKTPMVWRKLNRHIRAELDMNPELGMIKNVLIKSYDGLPYHLKSCFLYLSIFPEDRKISRRRLVRRWIAEGYSGEVSGEYQEETADRYFMELIDRSMISPSKKSIRSRKGIDSCQVHDLMREISILKSTEENLVLRLEEGCSLNAQGKKRHLAVSSNWNGNQSQFESIVDPSGIRSLTVFGKWKEFFLSEKMKFLRVLDLEGTSDLVQHHLDHIGKFLHLKYLSLKGCRGIFYLPDSVGNLKQLQTLDMAGTSITMLPKSIIKLRKLQYLRAWSKYQQEFLDNVTDACAACCTPMILGNVLEASGNYFRHDVFTFCCCVLFTTSARGLNPPGVVAPRGIRRLGALHTLGCVNIAGGKDILHDIGRLTGLRKLAVTNINKKNCHEFCSALACLNNLESLLVRSDGVPGLVGCLDGVALLASPPKSLQSLTLVGTLDKLPEWVKELPNLLKLKLKLTKLPELAPTIEVLGKLPELNILRFLRHSFQGNQLHFQFHGEAFQSLKVLELDRLDNIELVEFGVQAMPKLEQLLYCAHQNYKANAGLFSGLESLPSLKEFLLHTNDNYNDEFVKDVQEQLEKNTSSKAVLKRC